MLLVVVSSTQCAHKGIVLASLVLQGFWLYASTADLLTLSTASRWSKGLNWHYRQSQPRLVIDLEP